MHLGRSRLLISYSINAILAYNHRSRCIQRRTAIKFYKMMIFLSKFLSLFISFTNLSFPFGLTHFQLPPTKNFRTMLPERNHQEISFPPCCMQEGPRLSAFNFCIRTESGQEHFSVQHPIVEVRTRVSSRMSNMSGEGLIKERPRCTVGLTDWESHLNMVDQLWFATQICEDVDWNRCLDSLAFHCKHNRNCF